MNPSFGDNKRKPGGTASQLTEARRLAAIAQTWTQPSKQPRVPGAGGVPAALARSAGLLALKNAESLTAGNP